MTWHVMLMTIQRDFPLVLFDDIQILAVNAIPQRSQVSCKTECPCELRAYSLSVNSISWDPNARVTGHNDTSLVSLHLEITIRLLFSCE